MEPKEEMPSMLWGLDPIFSAYARLYIRDILQMTESTQVPGIYFYNSHPIYKVDVLGIVVYKRERDDFFCYGVDDSTGVINCLCWKNDLIKEAFVPGDTKKIGGAQGGFDPVAEMRKLQRAQQNRCHVEIGELLRVRGPVKTTRQQREISASVFYKVDDPLMAVQISWMMEVPELYRQCYDKPLQLQSNNTSNASVSSTSKAVNIIRDFLNQKSVAKFRPYDVQELLQPLILNQLKATPGDQEPVAGPSGCQQLRQLLKEALQTLQDEGFIYRKVKSQDEVYSVTGQDKELVIAVKDVIREDSKREKYAEKGCHVLHILSAVRQRYSLNLSKAALELVLKSLECNSDIISCSDTHYTIL
ncbi:CST complex subunit STN1 isoform X1 [Boleophthalmus pectinirostris]|uniref:CST complex subunit STN1 isoform X1 n=1 Tax=Boleophthalmus pectinirostris TaxID=150288 RepID=UPI002431AB47|nr:CST complex subunit STN1 isoform X1 [Boleophthalmus pectinirostris]XP_055013876.1 CST complex subunit STN1 isoform X1 [Boleophthalmus pectinirostris]